MMNRTGETSRTLYYWTYQYEVIFYIFLAVLVYLWRENNQLVYPQILYLTLLLMSLNLAASLALKHWPSREWVLAFTTCANTATIAAIMAYSGRHESNLWVLFLLPISTACLLWRGREAAWITGGAISLNAVYSITAVTVWDTAIYLELLLKSSILVFSAAITHKVGQEEKGSTRALQRVREQLQQSQKMEAIGRLAGGIAHDFNNLLTAILGSTHFLFESIPSGDSKYPDVREIKNAATRAAALTHQLLAFSRQQTLQPKVLDLNAVIEDIEKLLRRLIREDISFQFDLDENLRPVKVDPGQIGQVIMNLAVNARDAMPNGGTIRLETSNIILNGPKIHPRFSIPPGPYVLLSISDTGTGMDAHTLDRLFEPFFTTKELGKGTGLGLSTVYGIVKQSGGYLVVSSKLAKGTTFNIYLPQVKEPIELSLRGPVEIPLLKGSETVLLAEDEARVRNLARRVLVKNGYQVLDAADGKQVLQKADGHRGPIHVFITDVVMPGISGPELHRRLKEVRPETKVLFISGYMDQDLLEYYVIHNDLPFLPKPFTPDSLLIKLRETLH